MYLVLYVDDEEDLLNIGKSFLEETREYDIVTCSSAPGALEALRSQPFDAIVSDYQMPGMDGIELLKRIREQFGDLPFVLFTGKGREEVVIQAIDHGADFYLQKGGDPSSAYAELSHKLRQAIEKKRAEASLRINEERLRMTQGIGRIGSWGSITRKHGSSGLLKMPLKFSGCPSPLTAWSALMMWRQVSPTGTRPARFSTRFSVPGMNTPLN